MRRLLAFLLLAAPSPALAHTGHLHWWELDTTWTWDPLVVVPLAISAALYITGVARLWRRVGAGRGVTLLQAGSFALGWGLLVTAVVSPLHWLGERLFTAHMIEHEILMALAAPLLVLARPMGAMVWALPMRWRRVLGGVGQVRVVARVWRVLVDPLVATVVHGAALWAWHAPGLYEAALAHPGVHWLQHVSFFVTALLFWWALVQGRERERAYGAAVFYLFVTAMHSGFLGILLALARSPVFPRQTAGSAEWGLSAVEDQQLAGVIMWVPAGLVYAAAALIMAGIWIARSSRSSNHAFAR